VRLAAVLFNGLLPPLKPNNIKYIIQGSGGKGWNFRITFVRKRLILSYFYNQLVSSSAAGLRSSAELE
jgi:hypothetical protein